MTLVRTRPPTDTGHNTLNGEPTLPQKPSPCASCSVMAKDIEETATPAAARRQRKRLTETPQENNAEKRGSMRVSMLVGVADNAIPPIGPA